MTLTIIALVTAFVAFTVSASAGLGGSLILIPIFVVAFGPKEGIALAALLLAANNVAKVVVYRKVIPIRASAYVIIMTMLGAAIGASLLVAAPDSWIHVAVIASIVLTLVAERSDWVNMQRTSAPTLAFFGGATSGFSGTSGPLKGVALRCLRLDRQALVGAASAVSLAGDLTKSLVYVQAAILQHQALTILVMAIPFMPLAALLGRRINRKLGERAYAGLFWTVMAGYTARLIWA